MKIEYDKFTYDGAWYAKDNIEFDGRDCNVDIQIYGYDEEIIPESSKNVFDCDWDVENGIGVCFVGQEIDEVGTQDIAL